MSRHPAPRPCGAAHTACALLALAAITAVGGCSSAGGASSLFPNSHTLLRTTRDLAAAARRYAPIPRELEKRAMLPYFVQPGDVLLLEITDLESEIRLPADQTIMPDGTIDLGEYGRIVVAGLTVEEIELLVLTTVRTAEGDQTIQPINVRLSIAESAVYYVLGEVNSPGAYPIIGRETVLDALMAAGGLSDSASEGKIILSRPTSPQSCRVVLPVCYDHIVQLGDTTTNYQIQPGDRIFVGTRTLCEAIRFWQSGTPTCPDCTTGGCRNPDLPLRAPFVIEADPVISPPEAIPLPSMSEALDGDAAELPAMPANPF
ncbi:MAG TPA: SLBB domain-containing protein [Lacipirellulaceae bacterium]|nr:SLBB domain-containing protein [Lacipirellulaceae bacterium]